MNSIRDANLYTLVARPRPTNPSYAFSLTDLVEPSFNADGSPSEARRRYYLLRNSASSASPNAYRLELRDAYSDAVLASVEAPMRDADPPTPPSKPASMSLIDREREAALAAVIAPEQEPAAKKKAKERKEDEGKPWWKHRRRDLRLYEPEVPLEFENSGGISFEWSFVYEDFRFRWRREAFSGGDYICTIDRRPDPSVEVCVARQAMKGKEAMIQLMDYNLERYRIQDLKGLELALYISIASIFDAADDRSSRNDTPPEASAPPQTASKAKIEAPAPSKKTSSGKQSITVDDFEDANPNEVIVTSDGKVDACVTKSTSLLNDSAILFIIIRATGDAALAKAMDVADLTKKKLSRSSIKQPLRQYVVDDDAAGSPQLPGSWGRTSDAIRNSSTSRSKNVSIFLSKIDLPDLEHRNNAAANSNSRGKSPNDNDRAGKNVTTALPPRPPARPSSGMSNGSGKSSRSNSASSMPGSFPGDGEQASGGDSSKANRWGRFLSPKWRQNS